MGSDPSCRRLGPIYSLEIFRKHEHEQFVHVFFVSYFGYKRDLLVQTAKEAEQH